MEEENLIEEQEQESMPDDSLFSSIISGFTGLDLGNEESENNVAMPMLLTSAPSPSSNEYIKKIKVGDNTYNIQASSIGKIDHLTINQEDTTTGLPSIYMHTGKEEINPTIILHKKANSGEYMGRIALLQDDSEALIKNGALYLAGSTIALKSSSVVIENKRTRHIGEILKPTSEFTNKCLFNSDSILQQVTVGPINNFRKKVYEYENNGQYYTRVEPDNNEFCIDTSGSTIKSRNDLLILSGWAYDRNGDPLKDGTYFIKIGGATFMFEVTSSDGKFGSPKTCLTESIELYLSNGTLVKPTQGNHIDQTLCTNDQGSVLKEPGYYIVEEDNVQYLIYCNNGFKGEKFKNYGQRKVNYLDIRNSGYYIEGYIDNHVVFSPYSVGDETSVDSGEPFQKRSISCNFEDIVKLVRYMKDNSQGPWSV